MSTIPVNRKEAILNKMLSPNKLSISALAKQEGLAKSTLYVWRDQLRQQGHTLPEPERSSENWSAHTKFNVIVETATLNESQLAEYCRSKGVYPEQVKAWSDVAIASQNGSQQSKDTKTAQEQQYRKQIKLLEREIQRKDKALAEAAALLILQKKMRALWEGGEEK